MRRRLHDPSQRQLPAFTFQSQSPVPGTRYEATITATRGDAVRESKLVLFEQR